MLHLYDTQPDPLAFLDKIDGDMDRAKDAARLSRSLFNPKVVLMTARLREELQRAS